MYPDSAEGEALDNVGAITGAVRLAPTNTEVLLSLNLDPGTTVPLGSVVSNSATGDRFATDAAATNPEAYAQNVEVAATAEETGPVQADAYSIDQIETPVSGWTARAAVDAANSETYTLSDGLTLLVKVDDETAAQTVVFLTADFADIANATAAEVADKIDSSLVGASAVDAGGKPRIYSDTDGPGSAIEVTGGTANAALGFPTVKVAGLNQADETVLGRDLETDPAFRLRRLLLLSAQGDATVEAILADVLNVEGVLEAKVFENTTLITNVDGVPGKAFEVVVHGPSATDADIAEAIFNSKAAGIQAYGTDISETVIDVQGESHLIEATRATLIEIWIEMALTVNTDTFNGPVYPSNGDTLVKEAITALGELIGIGDDVITERLKSVVFSVAGVLDITSFLIGIVDPPVSSSNITIASRELADFDTARITVNT